MLWSGKVTMQAATREEKNQEVNSISLPNMRATLLSRPITCATRMECSVSCFRQPSKYIPNMAQV